MGVRSDGVSPRKKRLVLLVVIGVALIGIGAHYVSTAPTIYYNVIIEGNQSTQPEQGEVIQFSELTPEEQERIADALDNGVTSFGPDEIATFESKQYVEHEGVYYEYKISRFYEYGIGRAVLGGVLALTGVVVSLLAALGLR